MSGERKSGKLTYKKIVFSYSVYGEDGEYTGRATVTIHQGSHVENVMLELVCNFKTLEEAEKEIINSAKIRIDKHIDELFK